MDDFYGYESDTEDGYDTSLVETENGDQPTATSLDKLVTRPRRHHQSG